MSSAHPVTVSILRRVRADRLDEVTHWVQDGVNLANKRPGFLGSGWIRAGEGSADWQMLYRFASEESLAAWEDSPERRAWLAHGEPLVERMRVQKTTGIEGWFDEPAVAEDAQPTPVRAAPPRWKQALSIWIGFLPVNLAFTLLSGLVPGWAEVPVALRVLITVSVLTPIMAYWVLPFVTRLLAPWLHRR